VAIMLATVAVYMWFTFAASERAHRDPTRDERQATRTANTKAIDSLRTSRR